MRMHRIYVYYELRAEKEDIFVDSEKKTAN